MMELFQDRLQKSIFLVGDDGQMEKLIRRMPEFDNAAINTSLDIMTGIAEAVSAKPDIIMLNLCNCGANGPAITEALKVASQTSRIIGFGEAWTEVYYSSMQAMGMKDLIIMPAPLHEIRHIIFPELQHNTPGSAYHDSQTIPVAHEDVSAMINVFSSMVSGSFMEICHELSVSVSLGPDTLSRKAEEAFTSFLKVRQVKIYSDLRDCATDTSEFGAVNHFDVPLISISEENFGIMRIWPDDHNPDMDLINSVAGYLAALLNLAWREHNLRSLATTDELTGAYNRRYLESFLRQLLDKTQQQDIKIAVLVFDIDNFKYFNDTYGHIAGDDILCQAIDLVRQCCRKHDVVARLGGDEFAVLFWDSPDIERDNKNITPPSETMPSHAEMVMRISDRFRKKISECRCASRYGSHVSKLTISGGVASYPTDGKTVKQLLIAADTALLKAKTDGKDKINLVK